MSEQVNVQVESGVSIENSNIQTSINSAADQLANAFNNRKAANDSMKELKKALKEKLQEDPRYLDLEKQEKELKHSLANLKEQIKDIKKDKEDIEMETEEWQELDDFVDEQENKFHEEKDTVVAQLSRELADNGMIAEVVYKSGQLILIVARA